MKSGLQQSQAKLQSLVDQHNELGQKKPLLFGKKAWEAQQHAPKMKSRGMSR